MWVREREREREKCFRSIDIFEDRETARKFRKTVQKFLTSETASELGKSDRSRCQFVDPRLETMSGLKPCGGSSSSLQVIASSNGTTKLFVPPASPIEDRGTAIPIEDRNRAIPERLRLCGVIVKGLPVSLM
ncbi:hypothetical protein DY000_02020479 [Brassica cretica]|uniref:Uncharacterized protein n=1 Tax=Brassica cretica TaxID=69181 RepID=A0ABQ7EAP5_BRACR|nr:hypothetical protein DY000_02020479 [Brassica cretica]